MPRRLEDLVLKDVITIRADFPVKYADSLMKYFGVECLVVTREGEPVGMITCSDVADKVNADPHVVLVQEVMSEPLLWVSSDTPHEEALRLMEEKDIRRLPLIGNLSSKPMLLGVLTLSDPPLEEEEEALASTP